MADRARGGLALFVFGAAAVASAPADAPSFEVFNSQPGPFFLLAVERPVVDFLVTVTASRAAFPTDGAWSEVLEVELDVFEEGPDLDDRTVFGQLARVTPDGRSVLTSTVGRIDASDFGTLVLSDESGLTSCSSDGCRKHYVVRFILLGLGALRTQWFLKAGIDWEDDALEVPEDAWVNIEIRPL